MKSVELRLLSTPSITHSPSSVNGNHSLKRRWRRLARYRDCSILLVAKLAPPPLDPRYSVRTRKQVLLLSALGQRCATPLRRNPPARTMWRLLPSQRRGLVRKRPSHRPAENGSPASRPSAQPDPRRET